MTTSIDHLETLLAAQKSIAIVWSIEDVQEVRPDLTAEQCWEVLTDARRRHDACIGINWDVLSCVAAEQFGDAPEGDRP